MHLITVRHGAYEFGHGQFLTEAGNSQIEGLALNIEKALGSNKTTKIFSSPEPRAWRTAVKLAERLDAPFNHRKDVRPELFSSDKIEPQLDAIAKIIEAERQDCEVLIFVTHAETCEQLPPWFYRQQTGQTKPVDMHFIRNGEGTILDLESPDPDAAILFV